MKVIVSANARHSHSIRLPELAIKRNVGIRVLDELANLRVAKIFDVRSRSRVNGPYGPKNYRRGTNSHLAVADAVTLMSLARIAVRGPPVMSPVTTAWPMS